METAEGLCNGYVRNQMMASEPSDAEDFVRCAVQAERARIRIRDSTEGRDGLEPVSRPVAAGEAERVKPPREKSRWGPEGETAAQRASEGRPNGR